LVGVATGPASQICVLDIDKKHPEAGAWYAQHRGRLLPTRVHRTRSGGLHLIYGNEDGLRCSAGKIARGIDVRGDGGYIVWWPAVGLPVLSDVPIAPWPEWLAELAQQPPPPPPVCCDAAVETEEAQRDDDDTPAERKRRRQVTLTRTLGIIGTVAEAPEGTRNSVLFWATCRARDMLVDGKLEHRDGMEMLAALRKAASRAGLHPHEINRTITSAMRAAA
jgi:hypothetical protein